MNVTDIMQVIEAKRLACKLHKTTLCSRVDISTTYYNDLLNGRYNPAFSIVKGLIEAVGLHFILIDGVSMRI